MRKSAEQYNIEHIKREELKAKATEPKVKAACKTKAAKAEKPAKKAKATKAEAAEKPAKTRKKLKNNP